MTFNRITPWRFPGQPFAASSYLSSAVPSQLHAARRAGAGAVSRQAGDQSRLRLPDHEARPGSTHGYDIVNHNRLNPEIGDEADFQAFVAALRERGLGLILDIVPNHMGLG